MKQKSEAPRLEAHAPRRETQEPTYEDELTNKIRAEIRIIQVLSHEWRRVKALAVRVAKNLGKDLEDGGGLYIWHNVEGLKRWDFETRMDEPVDPLKRTPSAVLEWFRSDEEARKAILLMEDLHVYFTSDQAIEILGHLRAISRGPPGSTLLLAQPFRSLPPELEKLVYVFEIPLPDRRVMEDVMNSVLWNMKIRPDGIPKDTKARVIEAALGLTSDEAEFVFTEIGQKLGQLTEELSEEWTSRIGRQKEQIIKRSGMLEYFHSQDRLEDVGGLEALKDWLLIRKRGFELAAREFGLTPPKGVLLLGVQGCGKSLIAKAVASAWGIPLLKFDLGKVFASHVGESEMNIRKALDIAKAVAPSILWIDEIEKGLSGVGSSDQSDAGTTARVFGTMLTWMQEKTEPVFVIATANNIAQMPPELLRKGRFDEIFFVDLPGLVNRKKIWVIHLRKRLGSRYDESAWAKSIEALARESVGYSGAEIEEAVNEGLYRAYSVEPKRGLTKEDISEALKATYPLSKVVADHIRTLRQWARLRARAASAEAGEEIEDEKQPIPRLKQEAPNPFLKAGSSDPPAGGASKFP